MKVSHRLNYFVIVFIYSMDSNKMNRNMLKTASPALRPVTITVGAVVMSKFFITSIYGNSKFSLYCMTCMLLSTMEMKVSPRTRKTVFSVVLLFHDKANITIT